MPDRRTLPLRLHQILSRISREGGDPAETATLAEAAAYIVQLEDRLMGPPPSSVSEVDALRTAKIMLDQHGAQEAWRILTTRAIQEHMAGDTTSRGITLAVQDALRKLTEGPGDKPRH